MRAPTTQEILAKCPEEIPSSTIPRKNKGGRPRTGRGAKWHSEEDRIKAATVYAVTGNASEVEKVTGIPAGTVRQWKTQEWWPQVVDRVRQEKDDELDVKFTKIVDKTIDQIQDRLEKGDYYYNVKSGTVERKPIGGKELSVMTSIFVDKRELLRRNQQSHVEQASVKQLLQQVAEGFRKMAGKQPNQTVLEGEIVDAEVVERPEQEGSAG